MNMRNSSIILVVCVALLAISCSKPPQSSNPAPTATPVPGQPQALPDNAFKANITLVDPPTKLRAGQKQTIQVRVKNVSDVLWYARGAEFNNSTDVKFVLAAGNRWLDAEDESLITDMDGRFGLNRDLKPGEETEIPLVIKAPSEPGEYILEVDAVQEGVSWFHDKGSPMARAKVSVVK